MKSNAFGFLIFTETGYVVFWRGESPAWFVLAFALFLAAWILEYDKSK
jgi:hypothetical protein